ncbi:1-acyldihydroxyacetone phosphate reductase [Schizosaccharomyces octosporus yFS286]|uniref:1-acyldihydroxyacetone phosphate reductase n=1 Tax=Schizosaccharomyces octosporus (strain yFS286) TaxID=483514 RepID=S9R9G9_SCHOY|nr:1-acyldihydroxyacetone phosphate reductase [Schizosaccharomyces octosporus yFS286]EPX70784.1 1-acyldihydroxyacetone phosphate reductase [Schizosaccharomyces octosporus yFS286]
MKDTEYVLITGCSEGGIGNALAVEFHKQGFKVIAASRRIETMANLAEMGIRTIVLDVSDTTSVSEAEKVVRSETGGKLHYLINNAGVSMIKAAVDLEIPKVHKLMEVNLYGPMRMNTAFQEQLIRAKGTIVHINSALSYGPMVFSSAYSASKAALLSYANTLRIELAPFGVQVTSVITGLISTSIFEKDGASLNESTFPENSIYYPYKDQLLSADNPADAATVSPQQYAEDVYQKLVRKRHWYQLFRRGVLPAQFWSGQYSQTIRILSFFPVDIFTPFVSSAAKLPSEASTEVD